MAKEKARHSDENRNENEFLQVDSGLGQLNTPEKEGEGEAETHLHSWLLVLSQMEKISPLNLITYYINTN
jgi:hypothetical protein